MALTSCIEGQFRMYPSFEMYYGRVSLIIWDTVIYSVREGREGIVHSSIWRQRATMSLNVQRRQRRGRVARTVVMCLAVWLEVSWQIRLLCDVYFLFSARLSAFFWMNAALCFAQEDHGSRELGAEAGAEADVHLSVPPIRAVPLLRGDRPHDCFRLSVWRGEVSSVSAASKKPLLPAFTFSGQLLSAQLVPTRVH